MRIESLYDALAHFPNIDGFWQANNLPETEAQIRGQLPQPGTAEWSSKSLELLILLARVQGLRQDLPGARATLDQVGQLIAEGRGRPDSKTELRWLLEQGRILCLSMNPAKAHDVFVQVWNLATESGQSFFAIEAALLLSTIRPPKSQNEWLQKALKIADSSKDQEARQWLSQLLLLDGWRAFDGHQFEKALEGFERAIAQASTTSHEDRGFLLQWSKARTLRALGRVAEALAIQESLLAKMSYLGRVNGHVYLEIAECKQILKAHDEAKTNFELAHAQLSADTWYSDNRSEELNRMKHLSKRSKF